MHTLAFSIAAFAALAAAAPTAQPAVPDSLSSRASSACFVVGSTTLPAEVSDLVPGLQKVVTCNTAKTTIAGVPDVTSGGVTFSDIDFSTSSQTPLQFALSEFATASPLASTNLTSFQSQLNTYLATEVGIRSVGGSLAIKVPKFFLEFQVSRIQTAQGNPPADAASQVSHLLTKVLTNAAGESQTLRDQVTALSTKLT
ncbi:hypothetical protein BX600DRAFT_461952 [Xylariales sp. PMI_506]|nr:hypothetical protein BX600DRAFT_461952 [Xylariales sp. PMI_506]